MNELLKDYAVGFFCGLCRYYCRGSFGADVRCRLFVACAGIIVAALLALMAPMCYHPWTILVVLVLVGIPILGHAVRTEYKKFKDLTR